MKKNTIVIVDDHQLFSAALRELIEKNTDYEVLYTVRHGQELTEMFRSPENIPGLVLLDIIMPVMDGFATAKWLQQEHSEVRVLALSMNNDEESILKMIRYGARGYILKDNSDDELKKALNALNEKGFYHTELVSGHLAAAFSRQDKKEKEISLSIREKEFLKLACSELTYKEIAGRMCLSPRTIDGYREALFEKLNVKSRVGLVLYAMNLQLL